MPRKNNKQVGPDGKAYTQEDNNDDVVREEDLSDDEDARRRRRRRKGEDELGKKKVLSDEYTPASLKKLRACIYCKIVLCTEQWRKNQMCPNCPDSRGFLDTTDCFESLISLILPRKSWIAEWQEMTELIPGVYAMAVSSGVEDFATARLDADSVRDYEEFD